MHLVGLSLSLSLALSLSLSLSLSLKHTLICIMMDGSENVKFPRVSLPFPQNPPYPPRAPPISPTLRHQPPINLTSITKNNFLPHGCTLHCTLCEQNVHSSLFMQLAQFHLDPYFPLGSPVSNAISLNSCTKREKNTCGQVNQEGHRQHMCLLCN